MIGDVLDSFHPDALQNFLDVVLPNIFCLPDMLTADNGFLYLCKLSKYL